MSSSQLPGRGRIYQSITQTIGDTPIVQLNRLAAQQGVKANLLAKLGSIGYASLIRELS